MVLNDVHMKKSRGRFNKVLRPEPEGGFTVLVPALPACVTYGRTLVESRQMAKDAIAAYIESLKKHSLLALLSHHHFQLARIVVDHCRPAYFEISFSVELAPKRPAFFLSALAGV
jgi:predicted RNase H-like HicB family nuclease